MPALINLKSITCQYRGQTVVENLSMHVNKGDIACLLGPSGCGKTTVLRAIAGLEPIYSGSIFHNDLCISKPDYTLAPERRQLGMVFQDYALFPHMTIADNISFGLRDKSTSEKNDTVNHLLDLVDLLSKRNNYPHELSGGQQQRVALARALAPNPQAILMDEPFSNLDVDLREQLSNQVKEILKDKGITGILVTHNQDEAFAMCDQIGVMQAGNILQWDTPFNLYHEPTNHFVAKFIGQGVFLDATVVSPHKFDTELGVISGDRAYQWQVGDKVQLLLRPDDVTPDPTSELKAVIVNKAFKGAETMYTLRLSSGSKILSVFPSHEDHAIGDQIGIHLDLQHLVAFPV